MAEDVTWLLLITDFIKHHPLAYDLKRDLDTGFTLFTSFSTGSENHWISATLSFPLYSCEAAEEHWLMD